MDQIFERTINGMKYTFMPLPYDPGFRVYRKLHKYMAPVLGMLAEALAPTAGQFLGRAKDDATLEDLVSEDVLKKARPLIEHVGGLIADDEFTAIIDSCLGYVLADGQQLQGAHFAPPGPEGKGRLGDYDQVVLWAVWSNWGRIFFEGVGTLDTLAARLGALPQTPQTSTSPPPSSLPGA